MAIMKGCETDAWATCLIEEIVQRMIA